jgi:hypothetical protein
MLNNKAQRRLPNPLQRATTAQPHGVKSVQAAADSTDHIVNSPPQFFAQDTPWPNQKLPVLAQNA